MSVKVTWGEGNDLYNRDNPHYESDTSKWERYMMNIKKGWVLFVKNGKSEMRLIENNFVLRKIDNLRMRGRNCIYNGEKTFDECVKEFEDNQHPLPYPEWGINGDRWTPSTPVEELKIKTKEVQ